MTRKDVMKLCRLCLAEEQVKISIFDEQDSKDEPHIFIKISTCLPVKLSKLDDLPKKICSECTSKINCFYKFWNDAIDSEKQLKIWLNDVSCHADEFQKVLSNSQQTSHSIKSKITETRSNNNRAMENSDVKEETIDIEEQTNILGYDDQINREENDDHPPKRPRRGASMRQILESLKESDDENDYLSSKTDNDTEQSDEDEDSKSFTEELDPENVPGTSSPDTSQNSHHSKQSHPNHLVPIVQLSEGDDWLHNEDITNPFAAEIHATLKKLGYKNPFVYPELKHKKKLLKKIESKNNTKWQCMICSDVKFNKPELMEHYETHKSETESIKGGKILGDYFMCPVCLTDFTSLISYEKHVELNHGEKQYNCETCHKAFKSLYSLSLHVNKRHNSEKIFRCSGCDFEDKDLKSLRSHIRLSHEQRVKYRCEICNKGFSSLSWYQEHKNFHTGAMPFECEVCRKSFPYTRYLIAHKKNMHPEMFSNVPINHECEICQKKFAHKKSLVLHLRGHTGESAVLCDMCGKSLSSSEHLKQHLRIHTGYKPHCCAVCGKGFAKKCNLTLHERVHSGEKPHICNVCGKGFSQRSTLVIHGRYHSGERPYRCQLCQKGFVAKGLLGVHMKTCVGPIPE